MSAAFDHDSLHDVVHRAELILYPEGVGTYRVYKSKIQNIKPGALLDIRYLSSSEIEFDIYQTESDPEHIKEARKFLENVELSGSWFDDSTGFLWKACPFCNATAPAACQHSNSCPLYMLRARVGLETQAPQRVDPPPTDENDGEILPPPPVVPPVVPRLGSPPEEVRYEPLCKFCNRRGCRGPQGYDYNCDGTPRNRDSMG